MVKYRLKRSDQHDRLFTEDGHTELEPEVEGDESVWSLEKGVYLLLREFPAPNTNTAYYEVQVDTWAVGKAVENPNISSQDLPPNLQAIIRDRYAA